MGSLRSFRDMPSWLRLFGSSLAKEGVDEDHVRLHQFEDVSIFESTNVPDMKIEDYIVLLFSALKKASASWHVAVVLMERLKEREVLAVNPYTVHRIVLTAVVIADKATNDYCMSNESYSRVGLVDCEDLNEMEVVLLKLLEFDVFVSKQQSEAALTRLCPCPASRARRGSLVSSSPTSSASGSSFTSIGYSSCESVADRDLAVTTPKPKPKFSRPAFTKASSCALFPLVGGSASFAVLSQVRAAPSTPPLGAASKGGPGRCELMSPEATMPPPLVLFGRAGTLRGKKTELEGKIIW